MRNISVAYTKEQIRYRSKTVTRRTGWIFLKAGDLLQPVEKTMGFKKGETVVKIGCPIRIISVRRELISDLLRPDYGMFEAIYEGFPEMSGRNFHDFFIKNFGVKTDSRITRIEFEYLPDYKHAEK